tara:strand:+ start:110 stop:301 length:192 start_codon:yes stop_codon:yes gene_type:complete
MDLQFNTNQDIINPEQKITNAPVFLRYGKKKFDYPDPKNIFETDFKNDSSKIIKVNNNENNNT